MVNRLIAALSLIIITPAASFANTVRVIDKETARRGFDVHVYDGYGVIVNFSASGEKVQSISMVDPSELRYSGDGNLCPPFATQDKCTNSPSNYVRFSTGKRLAFPGVISAPDGSTHTTVVTSGANGIQFYPLRLIPRRGTPSYTILQIR